MRRRLTWEHLISDLSLMGCTGTCEDTPPPVLLIFFSSISFVEVVALRVADARFPLPAPVLSLLEDTPSPVHLIFSSSINMIVVALRAADARYALPAPFLSFR